MGKGPRDSERTWTKRSGVYLRTDMVRLADTIELSSGWNVLCDAERVLSGGLLDVAIHVVEEAEARERREGRA